MYLSTEERKKLVNETLTSLVSLARDETQSRAVKRRAHDA